MGGANRFLDLFFDSLFSTNNKNSEREMMFMYSCALTVLILVLVFTITWYFAVLLGRARKGECPFKFRAVVEPGISAKGWQQSEVPLSRNDPARAELFEDLQGNIINGHGRDFSAHIFVRFGSDSVKSRKWLSEISALYVQSARQQEEASRSFKQGTDDGGLFGHLAISASGYRALGFDEGQIPRGSDPFERRSGGGYSNVFAEGMKARGRFLLDPDVQSWESGFRKNAHALLILAGDDQAVIDKAIVEISAGLGTAATIVNVERGEALYAELGSDSGDKRHVHIEHFGFVDGRSQPLFLEEQIEDEKRAGGIDRWDPAAPLSLVLVRDPLGKSEMSFGSFLVYRKLEQDVPGFAKAVGALARELNVSEELAGAMAMGRFKDGTPILMQGESGRTDLANNFDFRNDPRGLRCPFQAHIRKTNPRGESAGETTGDRTVEEEHSHRIVRRGIPYGRPQSGDDLGLLFICYQADIWEQFEFIQRRWCNNPYFLEPQKSNDSGYGASTGLDPVVGQAHPSSPAAAKAPSNWPGAWGEETRQVKTELANFVTLKGGEYFFSPSLSFFAGLA